MLPLWPNDERIRVAVYRALYGRAGLDRYPLMAVPSIHIIVRNGYVAPEGAVGNELDKRHASIEANGVSGVFLGDEPPVRGQVGGVRCGPHARCRPTPQRVSPTRPLARSAAG